MLLKALFGVFLLESLVLIEQERDFFLHIAHAENQTGPGLGIGRANLRIHLSQLLYILLSASTNTLTAISMKWSTEQVRNLRSKMGRV